MTLMRYGAYTKKKYTKSFRQQIEKMKTNVYAFYHVYNHVVDEQHRKLGKGEAI